MTSIIFSWESVKMTERISLYPLATGPILRLSTNYHKFIFQYGVGGAYQCVTRR